MLYTIQRLLHSSKLVNAYCELSDTNQKFRNPNLVLVLTLSLKDKAFDLIRKTYLHYARKEGNALFNDALNTFYLGLYGVRHMVKVTLCKVQNYIILSVSMRLLFYRRTVPLQEILFRTTHLTCTTSTSLPAGKNTSHLCTSTTVPERILPVESICDVDSVVLL